ncbi:MAG TPA: aminopeptidase [Clostridiales bacterium UBA8960]|jgi:D-aminopeptidase|nr:aminopeptidase [Clostridiales bacterium UBA8960]
MAIESYNFTVGEGKKGPRNLITDVKGVRVGHVTLSEGDINTGVTAILPHGGNLFREKVTAATYVINGFGKSIGTVQVDELGTIETPIILTNTLSVGIATNGLVKYMLDQNEEIGRSTGTVNPIVCECNDGFLNDIRGLNIKEAHVVEAISKCDVLFEQGSVGAGTGMCVFNLKGGIGSSSRVVELEGVSYTVGVLVLSNFGNLKTLQLSGMKIGEAFTALGSQVEQGSIIVIVATDIPMSDRQLKRVAKRVPAGMARTGAHFGNGSGDIVYAFSNANIVRHFETREIVECSIINENVIDKVFNAVIEATEESIINSMLHADTKTGRSGRVVKSLKSVLEQISGS